MERAISRYRADDSPIPQDFLPYATDAAHAAIADYLGPRNAPCPRNPFLNSLFLSLFVEAAALTYIAKLHSDGEWPAHPEAFALTWDGIKDLIESILGEPIK